ncbi:cyclic pyranopterin phosphate synthase [Candidatus Bathyarchaeota archaeon RBG_13_38_9]|nr:MAG: cyclic pyranopterin phosphate synthase [Candidatus Bathyarchaeota archaeon RBG_13_38_9]
MTADKYGRPIVNFRISLTQECDLECFYCHREGQEHSHSNDLMTPDEIIKIVKIGTEFGIKKVKLTGGEPLTRKDLSEIVQRLSSLSQIDEISLVTNARQLSLDRAVELRLSGLNRINVNLPSVNKDTYKKIVGKDIEPALAGINSAMEAKINPVKINMVLLKGLNSDDVKPMMHFAEDIGGILQIIELEPLKKAEEFYKQYHYPLDDLEKDFSAKASNVTVRKSMQNRRVYTLGNLKVEIVKPVENSDFCMHCTKLRLTSHGKLKPCLMNQETIDVITPIRRGEPPEVVQGLFRKAISHRKPYYTSIGIPAVE